VRRLLLGNLLRAELTGTTMKVPAEMFNTMDVRTHGILGKVATP